MNTAPTEVETKDGRSLTGVVKAQDDKALLLQTANESSYRPAQ
jgi:hypothetical protein